MALTGMPNSGDAGHSSRFLFAALVDGARRLLGGEEPRRPIGGVSRHRPAAPPSTEAGELIVPLSSFQMVGLSEVQAKLADRWPALAEKVHLIAQNTITRHLVKGDVYERHGEDGYLVLFASLGAKEAEFKSRVIAREIVQHLLGEGEAGGLGVNAKCTEVSVTALASGDHEMALAEALARAQPASEPAISGLGRPLAPDPQGARPLPSAEQSPVAGQKRLGPPPANPAERKRVKIQIHAYSPVWDTSQMTILRYRATAFGAPTGVRGDRANEAELFQLDMALMRAVGDDLRQLAERGRRLPVTLPIQHSSLGSGSQRAQLRLALGAIPPDLRKLLTVQICWPEDQFWTYSCKAFLEASRPLGVGWAALIDLEDPRAIPHAGEWLRVVGTVVRGEAQSDAEALRLMTAFAARARVLGMPCAAYDLGSRAMVLGAVAAGFRYVAGPAIHSDVPVLPHAVRFEPLDLYADLRQATAAAHTRE